MWYMTPHFPLTVLLGALALACGDTNPTTQFTWGQTLVSTETETSHGSGQRTEKRTFSISDSAPKLIAFRRGARDGDHELLLIPTVDGHGSMTTIDLEPCEEGDDCPPASEVSPFGGVDLPERELRVGELRTVVEEREFWWEVGTARTVGLPVQDTVRATS